MIRRILIITLVLSVLALMGVEAFGKALPQAGARRGHAVIDSRARTLDEASSFAPVRTTGGSPVGAVAQPLVDSRGALISQSWRDHQVIVQAYNSVAINPPVAGNPAGIHFAFTAQANPTSPTRWGYSCFDPENGSSPTPGGVVVGGRKSLRLAILSMSIVPSVYSPPSSVI